MAQTVTGEWIHIACAIHINEMSISKNGVISVIDYKIQKKRSKLVCQKSFLNDTSVSISRSYFQVCEICQGSGGCVQCCQKSCFASYHVTCAQAQFQYQSIVFNDGDSDLLVSSNATLCLKHTLVFTR